MTLIETTIAMGVLAVAIPLAMAALLRAGQSGSSAHSETRAPLIAEYLRTEIDAARNHGSELFGKLTSGQEFPAVEDSQNFAFGRNGEYLGKLSAANYASGIERLDEQPVYYIAGADGVLRGSGDDGLLVTVRVEFPAVRKAEKRDQLEFYTILP